MPVPVGTFLGPYKVLALLGAGGLGEVYRAHDPHLDREIALKMLPDHVASDASAIARLLREARAASALNDPTIVTVHAIVECERGWFIAMELVRGQTLRCLFGHPIPAATMLSIGLQLTRALHVAHSARIVHGDIKPENVMVREDGSVKLLDFGLARLIAPDRSVAAPSTSHIAGVVAGSPRYMSPEQASGELLSTASDIFSLGILLYEGLTGRHPFAAPTELATLASIVAETAPVASTLNPELPSACDWLLGKMLLKDPANRPTAAEVINYLNEIMSPQHPALSVRRVRQVRRTVGQETERAVLRRAYDRVLRGSGFLYALGGEAGVGKTTLVDEFLEDLKSAPQQAWIAIGRCSERLAGTEALLPLVEALDAVLSNDARGGVANRLFESLAPTWRLLITPSQAGDNALTPLSQTRMKRELCSFLHALSQFRPVVLFIDDLHWGDPSTLDMLAYLARHFEAMRILLIATYRQSELQLARHPFLRLKLELVAKGVCEDLEQAFLTRDEIRTYLDLCFPANQFSGALSAAIHERTEGNALFMSDLVRDLSSRGIICPSVDGWSLNREISAVARELPHSIRSAIYRKIDQLEPTDRKLLVAASVQGVQFESAVVGSCLGMDIVEVEERLLVLEQAHGIVSRETEILLPNGTPTTRYRIVHVLYQNALYDSLTPAMRVALCSTVARVLLDLYGTRNAEIAILLAQLFESAYDYGRAIEYLQVAASNAQRLFATAEAEALARRGLHLLSSLSEGIDRNRAELRLNLALAAARTWSQSPTEPVREPYYRALELAELLGDEPQQLTALRGLALLHDLRGDIELCLKFGERAASLGRRLQLETVHALGWLSIGSARQQEGKFRNALEGFEQCHSYRGPWSLEQRGGVGVDPGPVAEAMAGRIMCICGYPDKGLRRSTLGVAPLRAAGDWPTFTHAMIYAARVRILRREAAETLQLTADILDVIRDHDVARNASEPTTAFMHGWSQWLLGNRDGIDEMTQNLQRLLTTHLYRSRPEFVALLAETWLHEGRLDDGLELVRRELADAELRGAHMCDAELHRLWAELLVAQTVPADQTIGETVEHHFARAIGIAQEQEARLFELRAQTSLTRFHLRQGRIDGAVKLNELLNWFTEGFGTADLLDARGVLRSVSDAGHVLESSAAISSASARQEENGAYPRS